FLHAKPCFISPAARSSPNDSSPASRNKLLIQEPTGSVRFFLPSPRWGEGGKTNRTPLPRARIGQLLLRGWKPLADSFLVGEVLREAEGSDQHSPLSRGIREAVGQPFPELPQGHPRSRVRAPAVVRQKREHLGQVLRVAGPP